MMFVYGTSILLLLNVPITLGLITACHWTTTHHLTISLNAMMTINSNHMLCISHLIESGKTFNAFHLLSLYLFPSASYIHTNTVCWMYVQCWMYWCLCSQHQLQLYFPLSNLQIMFVFFSCKTYTTNIIFILLLSILLFPQVN